jgi:hypothetical protein
MLPKVLLVKVEHDYIVVRVTGTSYTASSRKAPDSAQLLVKYLPPKSDHRAPMSQAEFLAFAWQLANDKARELRWIA